MGMQIGEETIASDTSQPFDLTTAGKGLGAKAAFIEARGGNFSYRLSGSAAVASTWYSLVNTQKILLEGTDLAKFRVIREAAGTGSVYVTYYDRVPLKTNYGWDT